MDSVQTEGSRDKNAKERTLFVEIVTIGDRMVAAC